MNSECEKIREELSACLDGFTASDKRQIIDGHIQTCMECCIFYAELQNTVKLVSSLGPVKPPPWLTAKILSKIKEKTKEKQGIIQKLFQPLFRFPIATSATTVIAITTALFYVALVHTTKTTHLTDQLYLSSVQEDASPKKNRVVTLDNEAHITENTETSALAKTQEPERNNRMSDFLAYERQSGVDPGTTIHRDKQIASASRQEAAHRMILLVKNAESAVKEVEQLVRHKEIMLIRTEIHDDSGFLTVMVNAEKAKVFVEELKNLGEINKPVPTFWEADEEFKMEINFVEEPVLEH
jgi:hypothetical protein